MKSARTMLGGTDTSSDTDHLLQVLRRHRQQIEFNQSMLALAPPDSTCGESSVARHATTNDDKGIPPIHLGRLFTSTVSLYTGRPCRSQYHRRQKVQLDRCLPSQLPWVYPKPRSPALRLIFTSYPGVPAPCGATRGESPRLSRHSGMVTRTFWDL